MTIKQITLALVFLGAITSVNAQSFTRQTDEPLLANNSLSTITTANLRQTPIPTVSALESRELREHYSNKISAKLTLKLNTKLEILAADLKIN